MALLAEAQVCATLAVLVRVSELGVLISGLGVQISEMGVQIARICELLEER